MFFLKLIIILIIVFAIGFFIVKSNGFEQWFNKNIERAISKTGLREEIKNMQNNSNYIRSNSNAINGLNDAVKWLNDTINGLSQQNNQLRNEVGTLRKELDSLKKQVEQILNNQTLQKPIPLSPPPYNSVNAAPPPLKIEPVVPEAPPLLFAASATHNNPTGFSCEECSKEDDSLLFVIDRTSKDKANFYLNKRTTNSIEFIANIKYYSNLVDFVIINPRSPQSYRLVAEGRLQLIDDMWVVKEKAKIEIY